MGWPAVLLELFGRAVVKLPGEGVSAASEIYKEQHSGWREHEVARADSSMYNPCFVGSLQPAGHLFDHSYAAVQVVGLRSASRGGSDRAEGGRGEGALPQAGQNLSE